MAFSRVVEIFNVVAIAMLNLTTVIHDLRLRSGTAPSLVDSVTWHSDPPKAQPAATLTNSGYFQVVKSSGSVSRFIP